MRFSYKRCNFFPFAYWSRWRWKPWQGLLFSPCKWGRDTNSPLFSNRENNGLQSVCSLHYVLSNILYLIILMQVTFVQFYGVFLDRYTKSIYALLCRSIVWSLLCYCLRARDHCCVRCDVTLDLLFTWYMVHQPFYVSDTLMFISVKLSFKDSSMLFSRLKKKHCSCSLSLYVCLDCMCKRSLRVYLGSIHYLYCRRGCRGYILKGHNYFNKKADDQKLYNWC